MPDHLAIRNAAPGDLDWVLALNGLHETELSPVGRGQLALLLDQAAFARVVEPEAAFLIAFDGEARYESQNFLWFRERQRRFLYIDRIAVARAWRRRGLARRLYGDLFAHGQRAGYRVVCAEVNSSPPNLASERFHDACGFRMVGEAEIGGGRKTVRYFTRALSPDDLGRRARPS